MAEVTGPDKVDMRKFLIKILEDWVVQHGPGTYTFSADSRYAISDFMAATDLLFNLKGVRKEPFTIG